MPGVDAVAAVAVTAPTLLTAIAATEGGATQGGAAGAEASLEVAIPVEGGNVT